MKTSPRGVLALLAFAAACADTAGPVVDAEPFDARTTADDYAALEHILATADWDGLAVVARGAPRGGPAAGGPAGAPLISDRHRGATFVYDPDVDDWVVDPTREGAPATGVRFILYEEVGGVPDPARERGWADLIDEGDVGAEDVALRLRVLEEGVATVDYALRVDHDGNRGLVVVDGFVVGDGRRLEFDVRVEGSEAGPNELVFDLGVPERDFTVDGRAVGSDGADDGEVRLAARHRSHRLDLDVVSRAGATEGAIDLDGAAFVQIGGTPDHPVFTRPDGAPLRPIEVLALLRVFDVVEDVFDLVEDVLDPVDDLVVLGLVL